MRKAGVNLLLPPTAMELPAEWQVPAFCLVEGARKRPFPERLERRQWERRDQRQSEK